MQNLTSSDLPATDLSAPQVSVLDAGAVHLGTVLSLVLDMCQRDLLIVQVGKEEGRPGLLLDWGRKVFYLRPGKRAGDGEMKDWEKCLLQTFINRPNISADSRFLSALVDCIGLGLGSSLESKGFSPGNPVLAQRNAEGGRSVLSCVSLLIGFAGSFAIIAGIFVGTSVAPGLGMATALVGVALFFGGFKLFRHSQHSSGEDITKVGLDTIAPWRQFRSLVEAGQLVPDSQTFERCLPYAIALTVSDKWMLQAEEAGVHPGILHTNSGEILFQHKSDFQDFLGYVSWAFGYGHDDDSGDGGD